jgi:hypothetical protein
MTEDEIIKEIEKLMIDPYPPSVHRPMSKKEWSRLQAAMKYSGVPRASNRLHGMFARHLGTTLIKRIKDHE